MMDQKMMEEKRHDVLWLLAMTAELVIIGIMTQSLANFLDEGVYTDRIIRYWVDVLLISGGGVLVWKVLNVLSCRYPEQYKRVQVLVLLVLLVFNLFVAIRAFSDFDFCISGVQLRNGEIQREVFWQSKLIGRTERMEEILHNNHLWRWENTAVLPVMGLGYGLLAIMCYFWVCWLWLFYSFDCTWYLQRETKLEIRIGGEKLLGLDLTRLTYYSALLPVILKLVGQFLPLYGPEVFCGGILFFNGDVSFLAVDPAEAGILQLLTMAYLLCQPCVEEEKHQSLPSGEEEERIEEPLPEMVMEEESVAPAQEAAPPEEAEAPRILAIEASRKAECEYIYSDRDDERGYECFPLVMKSVWREWFRYPYFFYVRPGYTYRTVYRDEYRESGEWGNHVQIDNVGDWVEVVLPEEQIRIRFAIF